MHPLLRKIFNMVHARILGPNHQLDRSFNRPLRQILREYLSLIPRGFGQAVFRSTEIICGGSGANALVTLPRKGDTFDLDGFGVSTEALPDWVREQLQMPSTEELLEMFLEQATSSHD